MHYRLLRTLFILPFLIVFTHFGNAQFKLQTFGKIQNLGAKGEKPIDFKTVFPQKAQVYVQLTYPQEPAFYTIDCFLIGENGEEKMRGTTDIKTFEPKSAKSITSWQSLGMMYDAGKYKIKAIRQSDKQVVAEGEFTVTGEVAATAVAPAPVSVVFCDDTDDNFNPIKPVSSITAGQGVNFLAKLKDGIGAKFFIWAVFEIKANGDEILFKDMRENVDNEKNRWFATVQKTNFPKAGKYAVYMLPQNATNSGMTVNKPTTYYARGVLTVK